MKNKKKLISRIVILLMVSVICLLGILFTVKSKMNAKETIADTTADNTTQEQTDEQLEDFANMEIAEAVTEETEEQPKVADNQQTETSQVNTVKNNRQPSKVWQILHKNKLLQHRHKLKLQKQREKNLLEMTQ